MQYIFCMSEYAQITLGEIDGILTYSFNVPAALLGLHEVVTDEMSVKQAAKSISPIISQDETVLISDRPNAAEVWVSGQPVLGMAA